jgi:hypothetical protein
LSKDEKLKQFFEQLRSKSNPTVRDILNAVAATGDVSEITSVILSYAASMGINAEVELADLTRAQDTTRQEAAFQETAVGLAEKSGALTGESDPEKRRKLLDSIRKTAASIGTFGK